jgi:hypothetical protein
VVDIAPVNADLLARYMVVRDTLVALTGRLAAELASTAPDATVLNALCRSARRSGVAPDPPPAAGTGDAPSHPFCG